MTSTMLRIARTARALRQSGVIPYRFVDGALEVLLISNRSGLRLLVPKGQIGRGCDAVESARREAFEEAGVEGHVHRERIGSIAGLHRGVRCRIDLWPMRVVMMHAEWPEMGFRQRWWVSAHDAPRLLDRRDLSALIDQLPAALMHARVAA